MCDYISLQDYSFISKVSVYSKHYFLTVLAIFNCKHNLNEVVFFLIFSSIH